MLSTSNPVGTPVSGLICHCSSKCCWCLLLGHWETQAQTDRFQLSMYLFLPFFPSGANPFKSKTHSRVSPKIPPQRTASSQTLSWVLQSQLQKSDAVCVCVCGVNSIALLSADRAMELVKGLGNKPDEERLRDLWGF